MTVTVNRSDREASFYLPVGTGFLLAGRLQERGWEIPFCGKWNQNDDLVRIKIPRTQTDADLVADLAAILPDLDIEIDIEDHYYEGED